MDDTVSREEFEALRSTVLETLELQQRQIDTMSTALIAMNNGGKALSVMMTEHRAHIAYLSAAVKALHGNPETIN